MCTGPHLPAVGYRTPPPQKLRNHCPVTGCAWRSLKLTLLVGHLSYHEGKHVTRRSGSRRARHATCPSALPVHPVTYRGTAAAHRPAREHKAALLPHRGPWGPFRRGCEGQRETVKGFEGGTEPRRAARTSDGL